MSRINLLPWRQERRQELKREFIAVNVFVAIVAVVIVGIGYTYLTAEINDQNERNSYISGQIDQLDSQIKQIDDLTKRRDELLARMKIIEDLQGRRPGVVHVFDEFVRVLPDGVYFQSLDRVGDKFTIHGVAETKNEVSNLMRNLDASPWFQSPQLSSVVEDPKKDTPAINSPGQSTKAAAPDLPASNQFTLTVMLRPQDVPGKDGAANTQNSGGGK